MRKSNPQRRVNNSAAKTEDAARIFSKLMFEGKVRAALKFIEKNANSGLLPSSDDDIHKLKEKHPAPAIVQSESFLQGPVQLPCRAHFADINESLILKAVTHTKGAGGPSQLDADQYRRILCSNHFKVEAKDLREEIASFSLKIATEVTDPLCLETYTACRLIPLDKNPGIRPIGVGEVLRRIVGKAIAWSLKQEVSQRLDHSKCQQACKEVQKLRYTQCR